MKVSVLVLMLGLAAFLVVANQQERAIGLLPQFTQGGAELQESSGRQSQDKRKGPAAEKLQSSGKTKTDEPLLLLDDEPLLLLDDEGSSAEGRNVADNSRCHVCHLNYADEAIAVIHAKADIGCTGCHGSCDEHIADESWASGGNGTAPGKMYRRREIEACCQKCHKSHDAPARKVIARWVERCPKEPGKMISPKAVVCTDCHGEHRLKERKCKWK